MFQAIEDLDPTATLARAEAAVGLRRAAEIEDLLLVAHWADLHGDEPAPSTDGRAWHGEDRLVRIGGEGTPPVRELCLSELAVAGESPGRVLRIAEAKTIEADPDGHRARLAEELRKRFVRCAPSDEHGLPMVYARVEPGDAAWIDAIVDRVADILATRPDLTPQSWSSYWRPTTQSRNRGSPDPRWSSTSTSTRLLSRACRRWLASRRSVRCSSTRYAAFSATHTSTCIRSSTSTPAPRSTATSTQPP